MTAHTCGNLWSAGRGLSTRHNGISFPEFQRFHKASTDRRKWNERPSAGVRCLRVGSARRSGHSRAAARKRKEVVLVVRKAGDKPVQYRKIKIEVVLSTAVPTARAD